ncbi:MAG: DUF4129 domain-containing protein [Anaerolineales bacterium]|nr:DUF4129 domain-containing protein [Anaerolineales bacterium]
MMLTPRKRRVIFLLGLAIAAMALLAMGLSGILLQGGGVLGAFATQDPSLNLAPGISTPDLQGIFYLFIFLYVLAFFSIFLTKEGRIRLVAMILLFALIYFCAHTLYDRVVEDPMPIPETTYMESDGLEPELTYTEEPAVMPDIQLTPNSWAVTAVGVVIAAAGATAIAAFLWLLIRRRLYPSIAEAIAEEAQAAVDVLESGGELKDAVIRCYAQMSQVLQTQLALTREPAMTPREFERVLGKMGFPQDAVHTLTQLFEQVRYGSIPAGESGVEQALSSLRAIIAHCESLKQ